MNILYNIKFYYGFWIDILLCYLMKCLNIFRFNYFNINFWKIISYIYIFEKKRVLNGKVLKILVYVKL